MAGGHTPFGTRVFGSRGPVIDPGTLSPALYLSGLPNDGLTPAAGNLATWRDKISGTNFAPSVGSSGITVFNDGSQGELPGIWSASICGGSFFRGFDNDGLANFPNTNGYTQYILAQASSNNDQGLAVFGWPVGTTGLALIYQPGGFCGGPPGQAMWTLGASCPGAAGHVVIKDGSTGFDTLISSPIGQVTWDLWTIVSDGSTITTLYRNGVIGPVLATGAVGLGSHLVFGGPSAGANFACSLVSAYILYTAQHTSSQIAGVRRWFRQHYGV